MKASEYVLHDATSLAQRVERGETTAADLIDAAVERIESLNGRLNAVVEQCFDEARDIARRPRQNALLSGIPFLAKDKNIEVAGLRLTASCRWLESLPAAVEDAPLAK